MILNALRLSGCGTQHPHRALGGTRVLLAAAPTTPPCFRHWRRSSSLRSGHIQRKNYFNFAFVAACGLLQTHFHGWGRKGRWHICRLPCIPLCESWIQKRPQAFLNPKFKMKFLKLWPKRTRRPFQIIPQDLAHRGSFLTKTKIGACRWSSCTSRFCFLCVGCGTKHSRCRAGSCRANRAAASRRKEKGMEEWSGALADAPFFWCNVVRTS